MKAPPLLLDSTQILVNTTILAARWNVDRRTVLRVCRLHEVEEIRLRPGGRVLFPRDMIEALEADLFLS